MSYPPLTPLDQYPLHRGDSDDDWACKERHGLPLGLTSTFDRLCFDWRCERCVTWALYWIDEVGRDQWMQWNPDWQSRSADVTLGWLVDRALYWLGKEQTNVPS